MRLAHSVALLASLLASSAALAWGADGHRLIAELAQLQLTATAAAEVDRLLGLERGATMVSVSTWADGKRSSATGPLHYVNFPDGDCSYSRQRDCADGRCVVEAIKEKVAVLKSRASDGERLAALKWVIHLVGDVHQPLHVGLASDKGGNLFQVRAFGRGSNLHAVWDGDLIRRRAGGPGQLLKDASAQGLIATSQPADPAGWARESCMTRRSAEFYPEERVIGQGYAERWDAVLVDRISLAGHRLARTLNDAMQLR